MWVCTAEQMNASESVGIKWNKKYISMFSVVPLDLSKT